MKKIRWCGLQILTGGAYFGTEDAIGHPAEFIISYPGLDKIVYKKDGSINYMYNERHPLEYLKNKNRLPQYIHFNRKMFDDFNNLDNIELISTDYSKISSKNKIYNSNLDLAIAVPVCSGLSGANTADHGKEDSSKNNNMKFLAQFTLEKLQPKVYIFENAPGLFTNKGKAVRDYLNSIADKYKYSITYVKTDTQLHDNIQQRVRTFVIFWKQLNNVAIPPIINGENIPNNSVIDFLARIPKNATQNDTDHLANYFIKENSYEFEFLKQKYGKDWRKIVGRCRFKGFIVFNNLVDEFIAYANNDSITKQYKHCVDKKAIGKGYFDRSHFICPNDHMPTIYHGNTWSMIHPTEPRHFTFREIMHCMGMPNDFDYLDSYRTFGSIIGQNVPARTIYHWIKEIKYILENWDNRRNIHPNGSNTSNIYFFDNIHPKNSYYESNNNKLSFGKYNG
jgi:site-specific DNA-cytosine methylase